MKMLMCVSEGNLIGYDDMLPWRDTNEMRFFRRLTLGCNVLMGRKTFESIGRPLNYRHNFVLSRYAGESNEDVTYVSSVEEFLSLPEAENYNTWVIGGAEIYNQFIKNHPKYISEVFFSVMPNSAIDETKFKDSTPVYGILDVLNRDWDILYNNKFEGNVFNTVVYQNRYTLPPDTNYFSVDANISNEGKITLFREEEPPTPKRINNKTTNLNEHVPTPMAKSSDKISIINDTSRMVTHQQMFETIFGPV